MCQFHEKTKAIGFGFSSKLPQIEVGPVSVPSFNLAEIDENGQFSCKK